MPFDYGNIVDAIGSAAKGTMRGLATGQLGQKGAAEEEQDARRKREQDAAEREAKWIQEQRHKKQERATKQKELEGQKKLKEHRNRQLALQRQANVEREQLRRGSINLWLQGQGQQVGVGGWLRDVLKSRQAQAEKSRVAEIEKQQLVDKETQARLGAANYSTRDMGY